MNNPNNHLFEFGPFCLDTNKLRLFRVAGDEVVRLAPVELNILCYLIENRARSVSIDELLEHFWKADVEENNVTQKISAIRKALGEKPRENKYIWTGEKAYRFVAKLHEASKDENEGTISPNDENLEENSKENRLKPTAENTLPLIQNGNQEITTEQPETENTAKDDSTPEKNVSEDGGSDEASSNQSVDEETDAKQLASNNASTKNPNDLMNTFGEWLFGTGKTISVILSGSIFLSALVSIWAYIINKIYLASILQAVTILVIIFFPSIKSDKKNDNQLNEDNKKAINHKTLEDLENAKSILDRYEIYWLFVLIFWFVLYLALALQQSLELNLEDLKPDTPEDHRFKIIGFSILIATLNNIPTGIIYLCFNLLNNRTEFKEGKVDDRKSIKNVFGALVIFFVSESLIFIISGSSGFSTETQLRILTFFSGLSGVLGGIFMALLFGRLQSQFLKPPFLLVFSLFSYAVIQSLFPFLEREKVLIIILVNLALFLKCLLSLYHNWMFESERLLFYLMETKGNYINLDDKWQNFRKLRKWKN